MKRMGAIVLVLAILGVAVSPPVAGAMRPCWYMPHGRTCGRRRHHQARRWPSLPPGDAQSSTHAIVSAARNTTYTRRSMSAAFRLLLDHLDPPLSHLVRRGDHVLLKVNRGCSSIRRPEERYTSHPLFVEAVVEATKDCGASCVAIGEDIVPNEHGASIWEATGLRQAARRTGARLVHFAAAGVSEIPSGLLYPRRHLITNAVRDTDVLINVANCRSHSNVILSGAIKNIFGTVVGRRKQLLHNLFPSSAGLSRAIADVYSLVQPDITFLDMTSVIEGHGLEPENTTVQPVGLILGSTDPVAVDTVAASAIGYDDLPIWTTMHAASMGLGCDSMARIEIRGLDWPTFARRRLLRPWISDVLTEGPYDRLTRLINNTLLRGRPKIASSKCNRCGACREHCPVGAVSVRHDGRFSIRAGDCVDCEWCVRVCPVDAIDLRRPRIVRILARRGV